MTRLNHIYTISRCTLAFVWLWHGLVPKLIVKHPDEVLPLLGMGVDKETADTIVMVSGVGEILFSLVLLLFWRARWPLWLTIVAMAGLLLGVFGTAPELTKGAFNPVTLNLLVIVTAVIALYSGNQESKEVNTT
ncbi:MAG: DoxX-like family protein [Chlorobi bacterium]|nr:DoxX-like family protein [Chlorobiota bacterium]